MRTTKIILLVPAALIFAIGCATTYGELRKMLSQEAVIDMTGMKQIEVADGVRSKTRIVRIPEQDQTLVQVSDEAGNQFDITFGSGVMMTSRVIPKSDFTFFYFDRDGDGMPELRSRKDRKTGVSIFERSASPEWTKSEPSKK